MVSVVSMRKPPSAILMPTITITVTISPSSVSSIVSFPPFISSSVIAVTVPSWAIIASIAIISGVSLPRAMRFSREARILPISRLRITRPLPIFSVYGAIVGTL
jgi:hypothetical protein